jgi:hypothetical protein
MSTEASFSRKSLSVLKLQSAGSLLCDASVNGAGDGRTIGTRIKKPWSEGKTNRRRSGNGYFFLQLFQQELFSAGQQHLILSMAAQAGRNPRIWLHLRHWASRKHWPAWSWQIQKDGHLLGQAM